MPQPQTSLLTTKQVAARMWVHVTTVRRWVRYGLLQASRDKGRLRFREEDVVRLTREWE